MLFPRKNPRYNSMDNAQITISPKCKFLIKNLSITGCCLECKSGFDDIKINKKYKINVKPEHKSHIHKFDIEVECKWIRNIADSSEMGFEIYSFPKGKNFQNYVDYLAFRSNFTR